MTDGDPDRYASRLDKISDSIDKSMTSIYATAFTAPAIAVGLLGLVNSRPGDGAESRALGYAGLAIAACLVLLHACVQIRFVFVLAGQRQAIEEYVERNRILPPGLYRWETGAATELSGSRTLDGRRNGVQYVQPVLSFSIVALVSTFGMVRLWHEQRASPLFDFSVALTAVTLLAAASSFYTAPQVKARVYDWTRRSLEDGT